MTTTIILETDRLRIRQFEEKDFQDIYRLNTDHAVMRYQVASGKLRTFEEEAMAFFSVIAEYPKNPDLGGWVVENKENNEFLGVTSLKYVPGQDDLMIGFRIKENQWGKGYATELAKSLIQYAFDRIKVNRIGAITNVDNYPSIRVLEKAGLKYEKQIKYNDWDMKYYAIENN
ncbi:MAG TPA: GNAT family N-acetyltransferase [Cytophagaceae bacterium]